MNGLLRGAAVVFVLAAGPASARQVEVFYGPMTRLDLIDAAIINSATASIDMAAFIVTNRSVINALNAAAARGITVKIILDKHENSATDRLYGAQIRFSNGDALFHLKSYSIDGQILRTGSANFTYSGETEQDNDVVIIRDPAAATRFTAHFENLWNAAAVSR
jgi:phosphatidylserine/phosphatidylglycerophosphate/cardiolipin synthase-like enzyme